MKKRSNILYSVAFTISLFATASCNNNSERKESGVKQEQTTSLLAENNWLLGSWKNITEKGYSVEIWTKVNDTLFQGYSYLIKGADSVPLETVHLAEKNGILYYIPTVNGQNGEKPVEFKLSAHTPNQLIFENPEHDFPTKIVYNQLSADSLLAQISGPNNGLIETRQFPMKRIK